MIRWFFYTFKAYIFNRKETLVSNKEKSAIIGGSGHTQKKEAAPRLQEDGSTQLQVTSNTDITGYYQT